MEAINLIKIFIACKQDQFFHLKTMYHQLHLDHQRPFDEF